ncbi:MAG: hypothetical protein LBU27_08495 [Candidatus Peribacteria bacterium]|nr:hypothetical protein [Candidatus Peribacteria bacterium]
MEAEVLLQRITVQMVILALVIMTVNATVGTVRQTVRIIHKTIVRMTRKITIRMIREMNQMIRTH